MLGGPAGGHNRFVSEIPAPVTPARSASELAVVAVVSVGGMIGALLRYQTGILLPDRDDRIPWTTFGINVIGCFALGMLVVLVTERGPVNRLVRPFLGTGVLGGFTTFSSFSLDTIVMIERGEWLLAGTYVLLSVVVCLIGLYLGLLVTRGVA